MAQEISPTNFASLMLSVVKSADRDIEFEMYRAAARSSAEFALETMLTAKRIRQNKYQDTGRFDLLDFALSQVTVEDGVHTEFGVYKGESLGFIANRIDSVVYGFDSFQGLPDDWFFGVGKGAFSLGGEAPHVDTLQRNFRLVVGPFTDSIPIFLKAINKPLAFMHVDCSLYASARDVLNGMADRIVPGTIAVFDEYFNYPGWQQHEHKALQEFCATYDRRVSYLAFAPSYHSVVVKFL